MTLVIGQKWKSSWSLRVWLILKRLGMDFTETRVVLDRPDTEDQIAPHSPSGRVPVLVIGELRLWDSLAIAEYLAEAHPELWPVDRDARALARCACAEMHAGFANLRRQCPMALGHRIDVVLEAKTESEIERITRLWMTMRKEFGQSEPFMFGRWSIADAFYTPIAARFLTYGIDLAAFGDDMSAQRYAETLMATPELNAWQAGCLAEAA